MSSIKTVPHAFVLVWCHADRVVPCEAYVADHNGRAVNGEDDDSTRATEAAFAAGKPIVTYEGYLTEAETRAASRDAGGGKTNADYQVRPLPAGSFFYVNDELHMVATIETLLDRYLASSTPGEANRLWNDIERQSWRDAQDGKPVDQARLTAVFNQVVDRFEWRYMQPAVAVEGGYDCETSIVMISSPTFIGLRRGIRDLNPGSIPIDSPHDCTGRVCGRSAKLLSIYSNGGHHWVGILEATVTRDV